MEGNTSSSSRCAPEPESGNAYRVRAVSCPGQGLPVAAIVLDDLERQFENAEDRLSCCTLKLCLSGPPCRDSLSRLSAWLMGGRLASVEIVHLKAAGDPDVLAGGSDRLVVKPISADKFRGFVTDVDWTQMNQRQGTFTLLTESTQSSTPQSATGPRSRIPRMSSSLSAAEHLDVVTAQQPLAAASAIPALGEAPSSLPCQESITALVSDLSLSLKSAKDDGEALGRRMEQMERQLKELKAVLSSSGNGRQENGGGEDEN